MNEIELREKYQLLCDRLTCILREDRRFSKTWGELFLSFPEIGRDWIDDYTALTDWTSVCRFVQDNVDGRADGVLDCYAHALTLLKSAQELLEGPELKNRLAEIRLRVICQVLNACFPGGGDGSYVWAPAFELLELPCGPEPGKSYEGCVKCADGRWMRPVEGTTDSNVFRQIGYFTFNSQGKATFAARHFAGLFRDWADNETGCRRIEV